MEDLKYNVMVSYDTYHDSRILLWLIEHKPVYKSVAIMDCTPVGMSFLYSFSSSEDADAFKLIFG